MEDEILEYTQHLKSRMRGRLQKERQKWLENGRELRKIQVNKLEIEKGKPL